jgi:hypothetical protein
MNFIGKLMLCCVALALLERIITALAIALGLALIYGLFYRPRNTVRIFALLIILRFPGWSLLALAVLSITALFARSDSA